MRKFIAADWAFGIKGAMENMIRKAFPSDLRSWPLIQQFDFDAYHIDETYLIVLLKDKLSGIPSGPGIPNIFPYQDHPGLPPRIKDVELWYAYLKNKFVLREDDAALIIPIHDSGKGAPDDFALFSEEEKEFWNYQIRFIIAVHKAHIGKPIYTVPITPANITYNIIGPNARVNMNSTDSSKNIVKQEVPEIFKELLRLIEKNLADNKERAELIKSVHEMEQSYGSASFLIKYQEFVGLAANHVTVLAPFLPALTKLLT